MRAGGAFTAGVVALVALAGCSSDPGSAATPTATAVTTTASASPTVEAAVAELRWADGTPVEGPTIDVADATDVRLGQEVTVTTELSAAEGWRPHVVDLQADGTYLAVDLRGDASPGGGPDGYGPLRLVTGDGVRTLRSPAPSDTDVFDTGSLAAFVDGGVAWVERSSGGAEWRVLHATDGKAEGRVVAEGDASSDVDVRALGPAAAYDDAGGTLRWDGERVPRSTTGTVRVTPSGADILVSTCTEDGCEIDVEGPDGSSSAFVRTSVEAYVLAADERHVVLYLSSDDDGDGQVWVLDRIARTALQMVGASGIDLDVDDGRVLLTTDPGVVDGLHDLLLIDLATQRVERLLVDRVTAGLSLAGDLVAWTTSAPVGGDGVGGAILSWPRAG